jgi:hypothetical protein
MLTRLKDTNWTVQRIGGNGNSCKTFFLLLVSYEGNMGRQSTCQSLGLKSMNLQMRVSLKGEFEEDDDQALHEFPNTEDIVDSTGKILNQQPLCDKLIKHHHLGTSKLVWLRTRSHEFFLPSFWHSFIESHFELSIV